MKSRILVVAALAAVITLVIAGVATANVLNTKHDLSVYSTSGGTVKDSGTNSEPCVYCHTPHQASTANAQDPLWNKALSSNVSYGVYASSTMNATPIDIGAGTLGSANPTHLCMSCHDGTLAVNAPLNPPSSGTIGAGVTIPASFTSNLGTDLSNDHPVNFTYNAALATADGGLATPPVTVSSVVLPLDGAGRLQCSTCHNVHNNTAVPFLRVSNTRSQMCSGCHTNK